MGASLTHSLQDDSLAAMMPSIGRRSCPLPRYLCERLGTSTLLRSYGCQRGAPCPWLTHDNLPLEGQDEGRQHGSAMAPSVAMDYHRAPSLQAALHHAQRGLEGRPPIIGVAEHQLRVRDAQDLLHRGAGAYTRGAGACARGAGVAGW